MAEYYNDGPIRAEINRVSSRLNAAVSRLTKEIATVHRESQRRDDQLTSQLAQLREDLHYVNRNLEQLIQNVSTSFDRLQGSFRNLQMATEEGHGRITQGIKDSEETAEQGLRRVSTGVAMTEVLQATKEADEMEVAMRDVVDEIERRVERAEAEVSNLREVYDKYTDDVRAGMEEDFQRIAAHVVQLQEHLEEVLLGLTVDEGEFSKGSAEVRSAQLVTTRHRGRRLNPAWAEVDRDRIGHFAQLQRRLEELVEDASVMTMELAPESDPDDLPGLAFPVIVVRRAEGTRGNQPSTETYGLSAPFEHCSERPVPPVELGAFFKTLSSFGDRLTSHRGVEVDPELKSKIRSSVGRLVELHMLEAEHATLIQEHLDMHPLSWLDS